MTLIITQSDIKRLLDYDSCIAAVEGAFRAQSEGNALHAGVLGTHVPGGGFHVKTAGLKNGNFFYAAKINANFPENPSLRSLPTIQGVLSLFDAVDGRLLAIMDSMEVTTIRTAAATAVAARYLARPDSRIATIIGCGNQGRSQLTALCRVLKLENVYAYDTNASLADSFANEMSRQLSLSITAIQDYKPSVKRSDVVVTCTPSRAPLIDQGDVSPGTFVGAVGADSDTKHEIGAQLMSSSKVIADVLEQCATIGDLHHALDAGVMSRDMVHAELGDVVSGKRDGRISHDEIIVFDSTGTALEDVAAASLIYERACDQRIGMKVDLGS